MAENVLTSRKRLLVVLILLAALMVLLVFRVGYWNIMRGDFLQEEAASQQISDTPVAAKRGAILDRNQNVLAQSAVSDTVVLMPNSIKEGNDDYVADTLSEILEMPRNEVYYKVATKVKTNDKGEEIKIGETWLKRQISNEQSEQIKAIQAQEGNKLKGVKLIADVTRYYPNKDLAAQIIGYTTMDGEGQTGIERRYNTTLAGRQGRMVAETDKYNNEVPNGREMVIEPIDGQNVVLTIDDVLQSFLETSCKEAYTDVGPESVLGAIMDVSNGEMLAIVNATDFDLNEPPRQDAETLQKLSANMVTASSFTPGSIFEVFTLAAAKDSSTLKESYQCDGKVALDGQEVVCAQVHGAQTPEEVIQNGCAVGAAIMASDMGRNTLFEYLSRFGFGEQTGIDFSTDTKGDLMEVKYASPTDVARIGEGENLKVSQIQLINAAASIVNGGTLHTPHLVMGLAGEDGTITKTYDTEVKGKTVNEDSSAFIREALVGNITSGKAGSAAMAEYSSGALFGAVQKYDGEGVIVQGKVISIYIGFAPADNPKYLVMVTLNGMDDSENAETAAIPYAKSVLEEILKYTYVEPDGTGEVQIQDNHENLEERTTVTVPDLAEMGMQAAIDTLSEAGLTYTTDGAGTVMEQSPAAGEQVESGTEVSLFMDNKSSEPTAPTSDSPGMVSVPDFSGMSFSEARDLAISTGLRFSAQGKGTMKSQYPQAGTTVAEGSAVTVGFKLNVG